MILLLALVVVVIALAATGVLGAGVLGGSSRRPGSGLLAALSAPVVVVVGLAVVAALAFGVVGRNGGGDNGDRIRSHSAGRTTSTTAPLSASRLQTVTTVLPAVVLEAAESDRFSNYLPIGGLAPGAVIRVRAQGFGEFERGTIEQCVTELGRLPSCLEGFPVQFDEHGGADFQLAVSNDFAPGGCRKGQPTCWLRLTGADSGRQATQQTVFIDAFLPGVITVAPDRGLTDGQTLDVAVTGYPAGGVAVPVFCAVPGAYDVERCSSPIPEAGFVVDASGAGHTSLPTAAGRAVCGPRRPCAVTVIVGSGFTAAAPVPVTFSSGPGVNYRADRVVRGVVTALVFLIVAVALAVKTDWTKPGEAATPALDAADLRTDQNLDDLFGADEELDARDPIPW